MHSGQLARVRKKLTAEPVTNCEQGVVKCRRQLSHRATPLRPYVIADEKISSSRQPSQQEANAMTVLVCAAVLTNYLEVAQHQGLNPQAELSRVDLTKNLMLDPGQAIPVHSAVQLLENGAVALRLTHHSIVVS